MVARRRVPRRRPGRGRRFFVSTTGRAGRNRGRGRRATSAATARGRRATAKPIRMDAANRVPSSKPKHRHSFERALQNHWVSSSIRRDGLPRLIAPCGGTASPPRARRAADPRRGGRSAACPLPRRPPPWRRAAHPGAWMPATAKCPAAQRGCRCRRSHYATRYTVARLTPSAGRDHAGRFPASVRPVAFAVRTPDLLDANESTWAFVFLRGVGCVGKPQVSALTVLVPESCDELWQEPNRDRPPGQGARAF
jgi:hypothetical protein